MVPLIGALDPNFDAIRPRGGTAGETTGYLFPPANDNGSPGDAFGFGDRDFYVRTIERKAANAVIIAHHYSRRIYSGSTLHLGIYVAGRLLGVLQYGYAMNPASADSVVAGTLMNEYLELNRM